MRCDHLDAIAIGQISVQAVAVISLVADQSCGEGVEEALSQNSFDELAFVRRSTLDTNGERKTVIIGDSDDFRPFPAPGGPDCKTPFFAPEKEASIKASSSSQFSSGMQLLGQYPQDAFQLALPHPLLEAAMAGLVRGGYFWGSSRHCAPVPKTHRIPLSTARVSCHGRPRPSVRRLGRKIGSMSFHWASLSSHRPRMPSFCLFSYLQQIAMLVPNHL